MCWRLVRVGILANAAFDALNAVSLMRVRPGPTTESWRPTSLNPASLSPMLWPRFVVVYADQYRTHASTGDHGSASFSNERHPLSLARIAAIVSVSVMAVSTSVAIHRRA